jgi:hypothetical protein
MTLGPLWTALLIAPLVPSSWWLARDGLRLPAGPARGFGAATLAWAWVTLGMQFLGSLGWLARGPLLGWSLAALAAGGLARLRRVPAVAAGAKGPREPLGLAGASALALTSWATLFVGLPSLVGPVKVVSDGPIYHLYFAIRWWKAGALVLVPTPFGESAAPYFPANGDLILAWLTVAWGGDTLAKVGQAPFFVLSAWAAYALARRVGVGRGAASVATSWFATSLPFLIFSFEPNADTVFTAGYLVAAWFLLDFGLGGSGTAGLATAGLAAGLAWGSKPTGTVFVPWLVLLGWALIARRGGGSRRVLGRAALLAVATAVPAAFWFGRNALLTGNPIYPAHVTLFGRTILAGWFDRAAMATSQFALPIGQLDALADLVLMVLDPRLAPAWMLAIGGAWAIGDRRPLRGWVWLFAGLAVLNVALYWVAIPYRTQQRFFLQGVGLAVVPLGRLLDRARLLPWLGVGLLALHLITPPIWPVRVGFSTFVPQNPMALILLPLDPRPLLALMNHPKGSAYLAALATTALGSVALAAAWAAWVRRPGAVRLAVAIAVGVAAAGLGAWAEAGKGTASPTYPNFPAYLPAWRTLERIAPAGGARVAYAGTNIPYYLFGGGLRNEVRYVNVDAHPGWLLHDYHRTAVSRGDPAVWDTTRPGWDRIHPDREAWLRNLRGAGIELLVVARAKPEDGPFGLDAQSFPIERRWAESDPTHFRPLYGVEPPDPEMRIYRVLGSESATDRDPGRHQ